MSRHTREEAEALVLQAIVELGERGYPPTYRELGDRIGLAHSAIYGHVRNLVQAGLVDDEPGIARSLRLSTSGRELFSEQYAGKPHA